MKKLLSLAVTIFLLCGMLVNVSAVGYGEELKNVPVKTYEQKFSDVPKTHWAFNYIAEMSERGVLSGYPDGKFYPDSQVTRAEFAKIMSTAAGLSVTQPTAQLFADVQISEWYASYVHTAKEYLSAYSQGGASYYLPNTPALREDIAVALVKLKGYSTTGADLSMLERMFSDYQSISDNAKIYVAIAIENGLISGYIDGTFKGQNGITRAEAATLLWRAYQYGNDNKTYDDSTIVDKEPVVEVEDQKPYVMKKLASANLENSSFATMDKDNNIYYIDVSDSCVYKIDVSNGKKEKYFNPNKLTYEVTEEQENEFEDESGKIELVTEEVTVAKYSSYQPQQVFYDKVSDKLLLNGYYEKVVEAGSSPQNDKVKFIYDITNREDKVFCKLKDETRYYSYKDYIQLALNSDYLILSNGWNTYRVDISSGEIEKFGLQRATGIDFIDTFKYGNNLYSICYGIYQYDFNEDALKKMTERISYESMGIKNDCCYFWDDEGSMFKVSVRNKMTTVLDINTLSENVEFEDMGNMRNIDEKFFVIDDETFIFYDTSMKAFRILTKNY